HELQGGERKTHTFFAAFGRDGISDVPLDWARSPLVARLPPPQYCASGAVPYLLPAADDGHADYLALVASAVEGDDTFAQKRERVNEYGWRTFGDLSADHENVYYKGARRPVVSHYNNQYDAVFGFGVQFMRTGDLRWWRFMNELASHTADIDVYHTSED